MVQFFSLDDVGLAITITVVDRADEIIDISSSTSRNIILKKPDGSLLTRAAIFVTNGADGKMCYILVSGDLDVTGQWTARGQIIVGSTEDYKTRQGDFKVLA